MSDKKAARAARATMLVERVERAHMTIWNARKQLEATMARMSPEERSDLWGDSARTAEELTEDC